MRKELLVAIVLGLFFGLIIGFGIWRANSAIKNDPSTSEVDTEEIDAKVAKTESIENADKPANTDSLSISTPQELDVITETPVKIQGLAPAGSSLIISAETKDYAVETTGTGVFEAEIDLANGVNQIILQQNNESTQPVVLTVIYSEDFK